MPLKKRSLGVIHAQDLAEEEVRAQEAGGICHYEVCVFTES